MRYLVTFLVLFGSLPLATQAAITINEIAWMGNADSANYEWIELRNDADTAVDVTSWSLSDGANLNIDLVGQIPASGYVVLERTSDDSASGTAFQIYTGALKNSGATLILRRADGQIEDQVTGGEDWSNLGGDNVTKETAQYTTAGWITAERTPGSENSNTQSIESTDKPSLTGSAQLAKSAAREPLTLTLPGVTLDLDIIAPGQVFINQPIQLDAQPSGVGDTIINSLQYEWNFGDLHTAVGKNPTHSYAYPGTYILFVSAEYGRQKAQTTKEITVLPVAISLTKNSAGDIQINNDSPYDINLSEYRLRAGAAMDIPLNTWLKSRQTITIPHGRVKAATKQLTALYDSSEQLIASLMPTNEWSNTFLSAAANEATIQKTQPKAIEVTEPRNQAFGFVPVVQAAELPEVDAVPQVPTPNLQPSSNTESNIPPKTENRTDGNSPNWPILGLILLLTFGCVVVLLQPLAKSDSVNKL